MTLASRLSFFASFPLCIGNFYFFIPQHQICHRFLLRGFPPNSTRLTCSMIGIDVSYLCARPRAAFAEYTPSTTILTSFMASSIVYPFPIRMPARRFLECMLAQVTIRSPIPLSPKNVSRRPPIAVPRRAIP